MEPVIYAADIGSITSGNFGWARLDPEHGYVHVDRDGGTEISALVDAVAEDLNGDHRGVALGFECPLFVPVPEDPFLLGAARHGEGNRPFSGGPGTAALVTGLVQTAWILRALRKQCPDIVAHLDWDQLSGAGRGLFLWEAFVTGKAKAATHVNDARIAAIAFRRSLPNPPEANAVGAQAPMSLIGAALVWSDWSRDSTLLHKSCLVVKATAGAAVGMEVQKLGGASVPKISSQPGSVHEKVSRVAEQIPRAAWTTYGGIAEMIGAIAIGVGGVLGAGGIPNEHRILNSKGQLPEMAPARHVELLKAEGVRFNNGRADPSNGGIPTRRKLVRWISTRLRMRSSARYRLRGTSYEHSPP